MAKEKIELTPEQLEKREALKKARTEAKARVRSAMRSAEFDPQLKADITILIGSGVRASGGGTRNVRTVILDALRESGKTGLTEMDIFKQFHIGRPEMNTNIRIWIKYVNDPEDRVWVHFDEKAEVYGVVGSGANPPKGWTGYIPKDEDIL